MDRVCEDRHRREVAYLLEQAELGRQREARARLEAEILLRGIVHLTRPLPFGDKCRRLFTAFRGGLEFDAAVLLRCGLKGRFYVTAANDDGLMGACAGAPALLQTALEEEALNVPDLADVEKAPGDQPSFIWSYRAALFSTIRIGKERALLSLLHHHPGHYSDFDLRLMRRLSVVATEALQSDIQRTMAVNASKLAALGEVIAGIAHEINQPLSVIGLGAANIRNLVEGSQQAEAVERKLTRIEEQVGLVGAIVKSIRAFAYPQRSAEPVEPLSLGELLATVRILATGGLRARGIELEIAVGPGCPPVMANRIGLQQVLVNLINNARDAICDRAGIGCIRIAANAEGGGLVRLTVRDNGGGVPEEALSQVFDSFYTLKAEGQGTGLGLPICKMLVESFGGTIAISNAEDGAEVTVQLAGA
jgi:signal transduction histidine kinase